MALTRTVIQAKVTKTAAFDGSEIDISGIVANTDVTLHLRVKNLVGKAVFEFADSVNNFSAKIPRILCSPQGTISGIQELHFSWHYPRELPGARFGTGSAEIRLSLVELTGANATVDYESWMEVAS